MNDFEELDEELFGEEQEDTGFAIDSPDKANWAVQKVKDEQERCALFVDAAVAEMARLKRHIDEANAKCTANTLFFMAHLNDYLDTVPAKKSKTQLSLDLPAGRIVRKLGGVKYDRCDDALVSALEGTEYVKSVPALKWAELKKALTVVDGVAMLAETGQVLEGITVTNTPDILEVR